MEQSKSSAKTFIKGATILTAAGILSRVLGLFFKVPLYHMYGSYGNGIFYNVTNIYNFLLMVSTVGLPVAISKMISENLAQKDYPAVMDTFHVSLKTLMVIGGISSLLLLFGAQLIINITKWPQDSFWSIIAIAPAPFIISICCAYRGFYQGFELMNPTAISQIIEQVVRVIIGLILCYIGVYTLNDIGLGVAGSVFGATAGGIAALAVLLLVFPLFKESYRRVFALAKSNEVRKSTKALFKRLLNIAIPVTLTSSIVSLFSVVDSMIYIPRLAVAGIGADLATEMIGDLGNAELLINIPLVISGNLAVAFMPSISHSFVLNERTELNDKINLSLQVLILVGIPCCVGISVLSSGISDLLFPGSGCGYYLYIYAYVTILMMISNTFQSLLQGIDRFRIPMITLGIAAVIRIICAYVFLGIPQINLYGIIYSGLITFLFLCISNYYFLYKFTGFTIDWKKVLAIIYSSVLMGLFVYSVYNLLIRFLPNIITLIVSIVVGVCIYFLAIVLTQAMSQEVLQSLPFSSKIEAVYNKLESFFDHG